MPFSRHESFVFLFLCTDLSPHTHERKTVQRFLPSCAILERALDLGVRRRRARSGRAVTPRTGLLGPPDGTPCGSCGRVLNHLLLVCDLLSTAYYFVNLLPIPKKGVRICILPCVYTEGANPPRMMKYITRFIFSNCFFDLAK